MPNYTCCFFDKAGHAVQPPEIIFADDDADAIAIAMTTPIADPRCASIEVWRLLRFVYRHVF